MEAAMQLGTNWADHYGLPPTSAFAHDLAEIVRIPTPTDDQEAVKRGAEWLAEYARRLGLEPHVIPGDPAPVVTVDVGAVGDPEATFVLWTGHDDTVEPSRPNHTEPR